MSSRYHRKVRFGEGRVGRWLLATALLTITAGFRCPGAEPTSLTEGTTGVGGFIAAGGAPGGVSETCLNKCDRLRQCEAGTNLEDCWAVCEEDLTTCSLDERRAVRSCYDTHLTNATCGVLDALFECLAAVPCHGAGVGGASTTTTATTVGVGGNRGTSTATTTTSGGGNFPPDVVAFCDDACFGLQDHTCITLVQPPIPFDTTTCRTNCANAVATCALPNQNLLMCVTALGAQCGTGPICLFTDPNFSCVSDPDAYYWGN